MRTRTTWFESKRVKVSGIFLQIKDQ